jgi:pyrroline-5-carboxylate reductase
MVTIVSITRIHDITLFILVFPPSYSDTPIVVRLPKIELYHFLPSRAIPAEKRIDLPLWFRYHKKRYYKYNEPKESNMNHTIGFIGGGSMGSAMMGGMVSSGLLSPEQIIASARTPETLRRLSDAYGIKTTPDNRTVAEKADVLFLAVKPYLYKEIIDEINDCVTENKLVVSIAAGVSLSMLDDYFGRPLKIIRTMPNTPAMVGAAMSALTPNEHVTESELAFALELFQSFGEAEAVPESLMDAVVGVSGSSPAYVYLFLEAMADAAVADGMPRSQAYKFAAQSVMGAAKMVLETGKHPGELKDAVCSPGGTTIAAVAKLEEKGLRDAVISAQRCCTARSREMEKS